MQSAFHSCTLWTPAAHSGTDTRVPVLSRELRAYENHAPKAHLRRLQCFEHCDGGLHLKLMTENDQSVGLGTQMQKREYVL